MSTAFGDLTLKVKGLKGLTGTSEKLVANVEYNNVDSEILVTYGDASTSTLDLSGLAGGSGGKTITSIAFNELTSKITILFSDNTSLETGALPLGEASAFPSAVAIDLSSTSANFDPVLKDAFHDFLGMLPPITDATNLTLVPNDGGTGSNYTRIDGKILRFFNRTLVDATDGVYSIKDNAVTIVEILPQEAYSLIWNEAGSKWVVIPGIINVKTRPSGFIFEDIPSTFTQPSA